MCQVKHVLLTDLTPHVKAESVRHKLPLLSQPRCQLAYLAPLVPLFILLCNSTV
jgi:hypothetical protein